MIKLILVNNYECEICSKYYSIFFDGECLCVLFLKHLFVDVFSLVRCLSLCISSRKSSGVLLIECYI